MGVEKVPEKFTYTCDFCGESREMRDRMRPAFWSDLTWAKEAYDFQGAAVADGTVKRLFCEDCSIAFGDSLEQFRQTIGRCAGIIKDGP